MEEPILLIIAILAPFICGAALWLIIKMIDAITDECKPTPKEYERGED